MNTKYFILLTATLTTFTSQCMNENDNQNKQLTMQSIREKRDILLQQNKCDHNKPMYTLDHNNPCCDVFSIFLNPENAHILSKKYNFNTTIWPIQHSISYFKSAKEVSHFKTINVDGCTILGAAAIAQFSSFDQQWIYTQRILAANYPPTNTDKNFAILNQYERCEKYIQNIMYFNWFLYNNDISLFPIIPQDIINHINLILFNLEKPLFYIKCKNI
jgi:hypothetical protein